MNGELNLFIIWQSGEPYINRILSDIADSFKIKKLYALKWGADICDRLTALYPNRDFNYKSPKVKELGATAEGCRLYAVVIIDPHPVFENNINQNVFTLKEKERIIYGENYLHGSDNESEAFHNIKSLLNITQTEFHQHRDLADCFYVVSKTKNGPKILESGLQRFKNIVQVFDTLSNNVEWTVLRNWQKMPDIPLIDGHGDIDILVDNYYKVLSVTNARTIHDLHYRVQHHIIIDDKRIPFDIRNVGDNYYPEDWGKSLIKNRVYDQGFYHLSETDHFWSLLYHGLIHKPYLKNDYICQLEKLGKKHGYIPNGLSLYKHKDAMALLKRYLFDFNYTIKRPDDKSVYFSCSFQGRLKHARRNIKLMVKNFIKRYANFSKDR